MNINFTLICEGKNIKWKWRDNVSASDPHDVAIPIRKSKDRIYKKWEST